MLSGIALKRLLVNIIRTNLLTSPILSGKDTKRFRVTCKTTKRLWLSGIFDGNDSNLPEYIFSITRDFIFSNDFGNVRF